MQPPTFIDVAHNPDGALALAEGLAEIAAGRSVVACIAALGDKDAGAMIAALAPALSRAVCTQLPPTGRNHASEALCRPIGRRSGAAELAEACERCRGRGRGASRTSGPRCGGRASSPPGGRGAVLLVTGSHYILGPARAALA